jgi:hypothetical protein
MFSARNTLRPRARLLAAPIRDLAFLPGGTLAALTSLGVEILDDALATTDTIPGSSLRGTRLFPLAGGRFLVCEHGFTELHVGARGGTLDEVDAGDRLFHDVVPTDAGFIATTIDKVLVDRHGERRWIELPSRIGRGLARWRDGAVVAGSDGIAALDAAGEIRATFDMSLNLSRRPVALASGVAVPGSDEIVVLDGSTVRATIPARPDDCQLAPFGNGIVVSADQEIAFWEIGDGEATLAFRWSRPVSLRGPEVAGDRIVIGAWHAPVAWILDAKGALLDEVSLPGTLLDACAFDDGVALRAQGSREIVWWRPGRELVRLEHDTEPDLVRAATTGIASAEDEILYRWQADAEGPDLPALDSGGLPFDTPIVIDGSVVTLRPGGRFALRGETPEGRLRRVKPGASFRPAATRAEALSLIEAMLARRFDAELPRFACTGTYYEASAQLAQLPLADTLPLHGRALFAPRGLDPDTLRYVAFAREAWLAEIGLALGMSARRVLAAVRAGQLPLDPPRPVPGWEYLGAFTTSGDLRVGDPCYVGKKQSGAFRLALDVEALPGSWHVFVRPGAGADAGRTAELAVMHTDGFDAVAAEELGSIGVDSASAGVFDRTCPKRDDGAPLEEGVVSRLGAVAWSGHGDGFYPVFGGRSKGRLAKIRLCFLGPSAPELDTTIAPKSSGTRRYAPSEHFEVGDTVEHAKFGTGTVFQVRPDGKV